jgi:hypothetical protein
MERENYDMKDLISAQNDELSKLRAEVRIIPELQSQISELSSKISKLMAAAEMRVPEVITVAETPKLRKKGGYKCVKGDRIDEMLAEFVNDNNLPIGFERLSEGL